MNARRLVSVGALGTALAVLAVGCLLDSEKAPVINERGGDFTITVSEGLTPEYSWEGNGVMVLSVARQSEPSEIVWEVCGSGVLLLKPGAPPGFVVSPPVQHGFAPEGTRERVRKELRLTPGVRYVVLVVQDGQANSARGWVEFTPQ
jgi:hypothetical protein